MHWAETTVLHTKQGLYLYSLSQFSAKTRSLLQLFSCVWRSWLLCILYMVQLRCNFSLAHKQFTHTFEQFTCTCMELLMACALLPTRNSQKIIRWSSEVVFDMASHVSLRYHVIDHHSVHRLVLGLVSHSQNLCHRALIH